MIESKREEIKEWINKYLAEQFISGSGDVSPYECIGEAQGILEYLDSQGVMNTALFHILEPIKNHDPKKLKRILNELKRLYYTSEISQYIFEKDMDGRIAVGEMLNRAIVYLEKSKLQG